MGRISVELREQRDKLITEVLAERNGHKLSEIVRTDFLNHPLFSALKNYDCVYQYVYNVMRQKIVTSESKASSLKPTNTRQSQSRFEQIVNRVSLRLPVGTSDQIARLLRVLRAEWSLLEQEALKAKQLEVTAREFERHRCPDASEELNEENKRHKERITFLESRVEALSKLTTPWQINDKHVVISS